jgi:hypothetical protein
VKNTATRTPATRVFDQVTSPLEEHPASSRLASMRCMRLHSCSCSFCCQNKTRSFIVQTSSLFGDLFHEEFDSLVTYIPLPMRDFLAAPGFGWTACVALCCHLSAGTRANKPSYRCRLSVQPCPGSRLSSSSSKRRARSPSLRHHICFYEGDPAQLLLGRLIVKSALVHQRGGKHQYQSVCTPRKKR